MKLSVSAALLGLLCLASCRSPDSPAPVSPNAQRHDPLARKWVPIQEPVVRRALPSTESLPPEKTSATAKVLRSSAPAQPAAPPRPAAQAEEKPGVFKRMTRAATSPLRMGGLGND